MFQAKLGKHVVQITMGKATMQSHQAAMERSTVHPPPLPCVRKYPQTQCGGEEPPTCDPVRTDGGAKPEDRGHDIFITK